MSVCPQADLPSVDKTLPLVIFGVLAVAAGIMSLWLPETLYTPMAQTVEQAEEWPEDYTMYCCKRGGREAEPELFSLKYHVPENGELFQKIMTEDTEGSPHDHERMM